MKRESLWEGERLTLERSLELTIESLQAYGPLYRHWALAYSGGKDSSTVVTLIAHLIASQMIQAPESLTVLYADTRMELPPLQAAAMRILNERQHRGVTVRVVLPALDDRFFVYMFGRGVPPPKNRFRWCTPQLKVELMEAALAELRAFYGEKFLMFTGVRLAEEQARILALMASNMWPNGWTGKEVRGDVLLPQVVADGMVQPLLGMEAADE